jgi:hypothetical protein
MALPMVALAQPSQREIAIPLDDLPVAQSRNTACDEPGLTVMTRKFLQQFDTPKTPLTAFAIGGNCPRLMDDEKELFCDCKSAQKILILRLLLFVL